MSIIPYSFEPERDADVSGSEHNDTTSDEADSMPTDPDRLRNADWCTCGSCVIMPTVSECMCCKEVDALSWRLFGLRCATVHESFEPVCLNYEVLRTAVSAMGDVTPGSITEPLSARCD